MKFCNFLLRVDGIREASLEDMKDVVAKGNHIFRPQKQKYLYSVDMDIIEERFFWMASDYDDAVRFRDYVINKKTGEKMPNPRSKEQVEPRQQFFACYDAQKHFLYMNDYNKKGFVEQYLSDTLQKEFKISNIYTSLDDFCKNIKTIRDFNIRKWIMYSAVEEHCFLKLVTSGDRTCQASFNLKYRMETFQYKEEVMV